MPELLKLNTVDKQIGKEYVEKVKAANKKGT